MADAALSKRLLIFRLQWIALALLLWVFRILPLDIASMLGGTAGRLLGPLLGIRHKMHENIDRAFPDISFEKKKGIIRDCWGHLGRIIAEYPHLENIARRRVEIAGAEHVEAAIKSGKGAILWSGHIGNWEVFAPALALHFGVDPTITYRALNNPYADRLLQRARALGGRITGIPKHHSSGKTLLQHAKEGRCIGILIDQKYNAGLPVPFFYQEAMTNPIAVKLAMHYNCALIPFRVERLGNEARFRLTFFPQQAINDDAGQPRSEIELLKECHSLMEEWIKQTPAQWLWMHKRWDSQNLKKPGAHNETL